VSICDEDASLRGCGMNAELSPRRFIVKHSDALDELTITFQEGVVATFRLLPGYPHVSPY
jgi:hypothetical protein